MNERVRDRLSDILDAIEQITKLLENKTLDDLNKDRVLRAAFGPMRFSKTAYLDLLKSIVRRLIKCSGIVICNHISIIVIVILFCFSSQNAMSETDNFPKQIPANLMAEFHPTWILPNGHFLRDEGLPIGSTYTVGEPQNKFSGKATEYDETGKLLWVANFDEPKQILDVATVGDQTFLLTVQYPASHYENDHGEMWYCRFVTCAPIDEAKWVRGQYQLQQCNENVGKCESVKTFGGGVLRITGAQNDLWAVEYDYSDIHGRHLPTAPAVTSLNRYSVSPFELKESKQAKGVIDIEVSDDGRTLAEQFYATGRASGLYDISDLGSGQYQRIGGMRPFERLPDPKTLFQPLCASFRYISSSNETICVTRASISYGIMILHGDGTFLAMKDQSLTPPLQLSDGSVMVTNHSGQILEIHKAMGE